MTNNIHGLPLGFLEGATGIIGEKDAKQLSEMIFCIAKQKDDFGRRIGIKDSMQELKNEIDGFMKSRPDLFPTKKGKNNAS